MYVNTALDKDIIKFVVTYSATKLLLSRVWPGKTLTLAMQDAMKISSTTLTWCPPASIINWYRAWLQTHENHQDGRQSKLTDNNVSDMIIVSLETPDIEGFDPAPAVHLLNSEVWEDGGLIFRTYLPIWLVLHGQDWQHLKRKLMSF